MRYGADVNIEDGGAAAARAIFVPGAAPSETAPEEFRFTATCDTLRTYRRNPSGLV